LRPVTRLEFGLEGAVDDLIAFWMRRYPKITFERTIALPASLDRRSEEAAFRIVQESLNNAVRHGAPTVIRVDLHTEDDDLAILVEDNGGGLKSGSGTGLGLAGMRERITALKGRFSVTEEPGKGVRITATLPLVREHEPA
jgi:signal transduction histidine kinase